MPQLNRQRVSTSLIVFSVLMIGCAGPGADDRHPQQIEPEKVVSHGEADRHSIQRGSTLFNGKAACFGCHGQNAEIRTLSPAKVTTLNPPPPDLRRPTSKSVRQLYLIIKYGIPATGMAPLEGTAKLRDEEIFDLIAYLLNQQGNPRPRSVITTQSFRPHTDTDVAIATMCEHEASAKYDTEEHCEDRYAKRYRELIIGRPPDISIARYTEIERDCRQRAEKDLDTLTLCYRAEYSASRPAAREHR